jgi:hypothetical protein
LITYDFGFLTNIRSFRSPTFTLEECKIVGIDDGVDFSFRQHSITTYVVSIGSVHGSSISMFFSMSCVTIKRKMCLPPWQQVKIHYSMFF